MPAPRGCQLWEGGGIPACTEADPPTLLTESQTLVKNITLATTSLRPVITGNFLKYAKMKISNPLNGVFGGGGGSSSYDNHPTENFHNDRN